MVSVRTPLKANTVLPSTSSLLASDVLFRRYNHCPPKHETRKCGTITVCKNYRGRSMWAIQTLTHIKYRTHTLLAIKMPALFYNGGIFKPLTPNKTVLTRWQQLRCSVESVAMDWVVKRRRRPRCRSWTSARKGKQSVKLSCSWSQTHIFLSFIHLPSNFTFPPVTSHKITAATNSYFMTTSCIRFSRLCFHDKRN